MNQGATSKPIAAPHPATQRRPWGKVVEGTKRAHASNAQQNKAAVSISIEVAVIALGTPSLAASCILEAIATKPVGKYRAV